MSVSLPLPSVVTASKALPANTPAVASASRVTPVEGGASFKQSLEKLEQKPTRQEEPSRSPEIGAEVPATEPPKASPEAANPTEPAAPMYIHLHEFRQAAASGGDGLSFLARLADGLGVKTSAAEVDPGDITLVDTTIVDTITPQLPLIPNAGLTTLDAAEAAATAMPSGETAGVPLPGLAAPKPAATALTTNKTTLALVPEPSGKILPQPVILGPDTAADADITKSTLDAAVSPPVIAPDAMKALGSDFKALLLQSAAAGAGEDLAAQAPVLTRDGEPAAVLSGSALASTPAQAVQFEGRTAIPMTVAFGQAQWSAALAERTAWLAGQSIQSAEIQLDPPELGPLQVKIQVSQDQATVSFVSANPAVREAVEQTMHRLRELFQEQGMSLVDAGVSDQQSRQQSGNGEGSEINSSAASVDDQLSIDPSLQTLVAAQPWGVDIEV